MNGLFKDTLAELFDKKAVYIFLVLTAFAVVITIFSGSFNMSINGSSKEMGLEEMGVEVGTPLLLGVSTLMALLTFLAVMLSAGILPTMFIKGRADYFLSKPISRTSLLLKKFLSVWIIYGLLVSTCGFICYLTGALVHSVFSNTIFIIIGYVFIELFLWLTFSFFIGILTGKTVSVIMSLFLLWATQMGLFMLFSSQIVAQIGYETLGKTLDYLYYLFPKMSELSSLLEGVIRETTSLNSYILYSSVGFSLSILFFTLVLFKRKNY